MKSVLLATAITAVLLGAVSHHPEGRRAAGMAEGPSWRQSAAPSWPEAPRTRMRSEG